MEKVNPFAGMTRKRFPAMHLMTALDGGVPLVHALAGSYFHIMHDEYPHNCIIKPFLNQGLSSLICEEFSYLSYDDTYVFYSMANLSIEQTQRWIAAGQQEIYFNPACGPLLEVPDSVRKYHEKYSIQKCKDYIQKIKSEFEVDISLHSLLIGIGLNKSKTIKESISLLESKVGQINNVIGYRDPDEIITIHNDHICKIVDKEFNKITEVTKEQAERIVKEIQ